MDWRFCQHSLENLRKVYPEFGVNSRYLSGYDGPLFKSMELGNYQVLPDCPGLRAAAQLPADVAKLLGRVNKEGRYVGAFAP